VRNVGQVFTGLALAVVSHAAVGQASLTIQMNKPQTPVIGLPFSADLSVHMVQHLANGVALKFEVKGHVYRSAGGMERYDGTTVSTDPANAESTTLVYILDKVKHTAVFYNSKTMRATVQQLQDTSTVTVRFLPLQETRIQNRIIKPENVTTTDLGKRTQGAMTLVGKRVTGTIPAGKVGNDQPLSVTGDVWVDPQLKLMVEEVEQDPLAGERTLALSNIHGEEPDSKLFEIPAGYTVHEMSAMPSGIPPAPVLMGGSGAASLKSPAQVAQQIEFAFKTSNAGFKNTVAYALAQNNDHLSDAQTLAEEAVTLEEQTTADVVAKGDDLLSFEQTVRLSSYWDTLGWVYYLEGKQDKAETYLRAAWELKPNPEYGLHLGSVYEAQQRPTEAEAMYRMCQSVGNSAAWKEKFDARLAKLGDSDAAPLPMEITTALPSLDLHVGEGDPEPVVEILIGHAGLPTVTYLAGEPTGETSVTKAIQSALAGSLPDSGPETILRRARVSCKAGRSPACALDFLTSRKTEVATPAP
jgi:hypothetical protein